MKSSSIIAIACLVLLANQAGVASGDLKHPDWHPDGDRLITEGNCFGSTDLFFIDLDAGTVHWLWDGGFAEGYPRWFPDGTGVVFHQIDNQQQARIYVATLNEYGKFSNPQRLTNGPFDIEPAPSPVGHTIAFTKPGENGLDIALVDVSTREIIRTWKTDVAENFPSWLPDGGSIVFHAKDNHGTEIYKRDLKTDKLTRLTNGDGPNMVANISSDGLTLAYSSERDDDREIYIRELESGKETRITTRVGRDGYPKLSPDSRIVAYHAVIDTDRTVVRILNIASGYTADFSCEQLSAISLPSQISDAS